MAGRPQAVQTHLIFLPIHLQEDHRPDNGPVGTQTLLLLIAEAKVRNLKKNEKDAKDVIVNASTDTKIAKVGQFPQIRRANSRAAVWMSSTSWMSPAYSVQEVE